jgi:hypothetical protein
MAVLRDSVILLDLLAYPSYMMLQYAPVRCVAGHVLAVIMETDAAPHHDHSRVYITAGHGL